MLIEVVCLKIIFFLTFNKSLYVILASLKSANVPYGDRTKNAQSNNNFSHSSLKCINSILELMNICGIQDLKGG